MPRSIATRLLALVITALAAILVPVGGVPGFGATCAAAAGEVRVTVVIEQPSAAPSVVCVSVPEGSTGADVTGLDVKLSMAAAVVMFSLVQK